MDLNISPDMLAKITEYQTVLNAYIEAYNQAVVKGIASGELSFYTTEETITLLLTHALAEVDNNFVQSLVIAKQILDELNSLQDETAQLHVLAAYLDRFVFNVLEMYQAAIEEGSSPQVNKKLF